MKWAFLMNCRDEIEAGMIIGVLEEEGIASQTKYRGSGDYLKIITGMGRDVDIYVPEDLVARAKEILSALEETVEEQDYPPES